VPVGKSRMLNLLAPLYLARRLIVQEYRKV
jgi:hypothetical protein